MAESVNSTTGGPPPRTRRVYRSPELLVYGSVRELTASGTGTQTETPGNKPLTKRP
jgi:hypothetical protein